MLKPAAPEVQEGPSEWNARYGGNKMVISTPQEIAAVAATIPEGSIMRMSDLRAEISARNHADYACPLTTGIFLRIVAEATEEALSQDKPAVAPWWRIVPDDRKLNLKLPGAGEIQRDRLIAEGWKVEPKGKNWILK